MTLAVASPPLGPLVLYPPWYFLISLSAIVPGLFFFFIFFWGSLCGTLVAHAGRRYLADIWWVFATLPPDVNVDVIACFFLGKGFFLILWAAWKRPLPPAPGLSTLNSGCASAGAYSKWPPPEVVRSGMGPGASKKKTAPKKTKRFFWKGASGHESLRDVSLRVREAA